MPLEDVADLIVEIPDYPKPGIRFKDLTPIFANGEAFAKVIKELSLRAQDATVIAGIEARGFVLGAALANYLGIGFVPIRKKGKLPRATYQATYELEYGIDAIEVHQDSFRETDRVLLIDDVLATGGTAAAAAAVVLQSGAKLSGLAVLLELTFLGGRTRLQEQFPGMTVSTILSE